MEAKVPNWFFVGVHDKDEKVLSLEVLFGGYHHNTAHILCDNSYQTEKVRDGSCLCPIWDPVSSNDRMFERVWRERKQ